MKLNWLSILLLFVLVVNAGMVATFMVKQHKLKAEFEEEAPRIGRKDKSKDEKFDFKIFMQQQLQLNDDQIVAFDQQHKTFMKKNWENKHQLDELDKQLLEEMTKLNPDTVLLKKLVEEMGATFKDKKKCFYQHYLHISAICEPNQRHKLDSLMYTFSEYRRHKMHNRP